MIRKIRKIRMLKNLEIVMYRNERACVCVKLLSINVFNVVYLLPPTLHIVARQPGYFMRCGGRWKCNYFPTDPLPLSTFARYRESRYANRNCYNTSTLYISGFVDSLSSKITDFLLSDKVGI